MLAAGLVMVAMEGAARVAAAAFDRERGVDFDANLGWHMLPHVEKRGGSWSATEPGRTNGHGWRDVERTVAKPAGQLRIAALGDSFTFGQGVDAGQRFTDRLEQAAGVEVLNFGACAFGTDQELLVFEHVAHAFDPDIVVLTVFLGNDLQDIRLEQQSGWSKPYFRLRDAALELVAPTYSWQTAIRTHSYVAEFLFQLLEHNEPASRVAPEWREADTLPLFTAIVERLQQGVTERGAQLLVLLAQPSSADGRVHRHGRADAVIAALAASAIPCIDTHADFMRDAAEPLYLDCGHWTAAGHAIVAEVLLRELREREMLPR